MLMLRRQGGGQPDPHGKCGCKIVGSYRHTGPSRTQTASGLMSPCYNRLEGSRRGEFNSDRSLHDGTRENFLLIPVSRDPTTC